MRIYAPIVRPNRVPVRLLSPRVTRVAGLLRVVPFDLCPFRWWLR